MKKAFAMKWADALESGKYKQAIHYLYNGKGYCCLGVACDLLGYKFTRSSYNNEVYVIANQKEPAKDEFDTEISDFFPQEVLEKIGIKTVDGVIQNKDISLAEMNDEGKKFKTIARVIRNNWENL